MGNYYPNEWSNKNDYMLDEFKFDEKRSGIVELSSANAKKVMAMISTDSAYRKTMLIDSKPEPSSKYNGSSAYWFKQLLDKSKEEKEKKILYAKEILYAVIAIDNENSTHLNGGNNNANTRERLRDTIAKEGLFEQIVDCVNSYSAKENNGKQAEIFAKLAFDENGSLHCSFASKFCHYAAKVANPSCDDFPIFDSVIMSVLPYYLAIYRAEGCKTNSINEYKKTVPKFAKENMPKDQNKWQKHLQSEYLKYIEIMQNLSDKTGVSKTGIDQILWYYYKGRKLDKRKITESVIEIVKKHD